MLNLLPPTEQSTIKKQYGLRRLIIFLMFLAVTGLIALIFSVPSYIFSSGKEKGVKNQLETVKKNLDYAMKEDFSGVLKETNEKLKTLKLASSNMVGELFAAAISHKTSGIKIIRMVFSGGGREKQQLFISGVATDRSSLVSFEKQLKSDGHFSDVVLPVGNLAKDSNINFSITILVNSKS